jgi:hydrogenase maturation protease
VKTIVVLGAGNELMKDEGVGVHVIRILQHRLPSSLSDAKLVDIGTSPNFDHLIEGADKIVIVDAVKGGYQPGTIYRFTPEQIVSEHAVTTSLHEMGLLESLKMIELAGSKLAETVVIGIEPAEVEVGLELSQELKRQMPKIIQTVLEEIG